MQVDEAEPSTSKPEAPKAEPSSYVLQNPARVTPAQERYITFLPDERWRPLRSNPPHSGILMLVDTRPGTACSLGRHVSGCGAGPELSAVTAARVARACSLAACEVASCCIHACMLMPCAHAWLWEALHYLCRVRMWEAFGARFG